MPRPSQDGLEWKETVLDITPQWSREPSIASIASVCRQVLSIPPESPCKVAAHASGLFNKLYIVKCTHGRLAMRISLPVYPRHKTRAEVATLRWVREHTKVPVPKVFNFGDSNDNEIGFEWILMDFMQGTSAHDRWRCMSMEQKVALTERIATFQLELSGLGRPAPTFRSIGSLELRAIRTDMVKRPEKAVPSLLVAPEFFMGDHLQYDIPRGPFCSSQDWLSAQLNIIILHQTAALKKAKDEDDKEEAEEILAVARKLLSLIPKIFPSTSNEPETTGLYHHDLHLNNILVDEKGEIAAVLDWECVSALPLWTLAKVPKFLDWPPREEEPRPDLYGDEPPNESATRPQKHNKQVSSHDDGKNELYYIHRMEYETTQLRRVYDDKMGRLMKACSLGDNIKINFLQAVSQCDGIWVKKTQRWANSIEAGKPLDFEDA